MVSRLWYSTLLQTNVSKEYTINIEKATVHMELLSWKKKTFQEKDLINSNQQIYFLLTEKKKSFSNLSSGVALGSWIRSRKCQD